MNGLLIDDLDIGPCGFVCFSDNGTILSANLTLVHMLHGQSRDELIGQNIESLLTISSRIFYQTHFFPLIRLHGQASEIFLTLKPASGESIPVICNAQRKLRDGIYTNQCIFFQAVQRGKYEQELLEAKRQAETALKENNELVRAKKELEERSIALDRKISTLSYLNAELLQLSHIITHDLQEPMRKISVYADKVLAENKERLAPQSMSDLEKAKMQCLLLRTIADSLEQLLSLNMDIEMEAIDLGILVPAAFNEALLQVGGEAKLVLPPLPKINGSLDQLTILFFQLFRNSLLYASPSTLPEITIDATVVQQNSFTQIEGMYRYIDFLRITIADNGSGFEIGPKLFSVQRKMGNGVFSLSFGLAFCKKVIDNHYGSISIVSTVGKGTIVTMLLPVG
jgi:sigma-B regulation protein RsbU (phosphoserine phosphatase)